MNEHSNRAIVVIRDLAQLVAVDAVHIGPSTMNSVFHVITVEILREFRTVLNRFLHHVLGSLNAEIQ
jgi:hypothetical protein